MVLVMAHFINSMMSLLGYVPLFYILLHSGTVCSLHTRILGSYTLNPCDYPSYITFIILVNTRFVHYTERHVLYLHNKIKRCLATLMFSVMCYYFCCLTAKFT
jgi:hypothetical protein